MSNDKLIKPSYVISTNCRMVFNAKGEKVKGGKPYLLVETPRGKLIMDEEVIPEFIEDLKEFIPKAEKTKK